MHVAAEREELLDRNPHVVHDPAQPRGVGVGDVADVTAHAPSVVGPGDVRHVPPVGEDDAVVGGAQDSVQPRLHGEAQRLEIGEPPRIAEAGPATAVSFVGQRAGRRAGRVARAPRPLHDLGEQHGVRPVRKGHNGVRRIVPREVEPHVAVEVLRVQPVAHRPVRGAVGIEIHRQQRQSSAVRRADECGVRIGGVDWPGEERLADLARELLADGS